MVNYLQLDISKTKDKIIRDTSHPSNCLFQLLNSGKLFCSLTRRTERLKRSFYPQSIRLLNQSMSLHPAFSLWHCNSHVTLPILPHNLSFHHFDLILMIIFYAASNAAAANLLYCYYQTYTHRNDSW